MKNHLKIKPGILVCLWAFLLFFLPGVLFAQSQVYQSKEIPDPAIIAYNIQLFEKYSGLTENNIQILGLQDMQAIGVYAIYFCWDNGCSDDMYLVRLNSNVWIMRDNIMPNKLLGRSSWRTVGVPVRNKKP